ncbi:MAG: hypothetical protein KC464_31400, partial [Myxococcales bacterium]|nr:hypothetical protein [Myxococcales bacterium]
ELEHDVCKGATDHFAATAPVVHLTYRTRELPQVGDVYVVQWIAEDVGDAAPPNTVIATVEDKVEVVAPGTLNYVVNSQLTRPTSGWPVGTYRVEIKLGDRVATTAHFAIE